jgi:hypothetical protein
MAVFMYKSIKSMPGRHIALQRVLAGSKAYPGRRRLYGQLRLQKTFYSYTGIPAGCGILLFLSPADNRVTAQEPGLYALQGLVILE